LAPTVGIMMTGFCYPGGILPIFSSTRLTNFAAADSSQIASHLIIGGHPHQQLASTSPYYSSLSRSFVVSPNDSQQVNEINSRRNQSVSESADLFSSAGFRQIFNS
jgi:hypothetical protein